MLDIETKYKQTFLISDDQNGNKLVNYIYNDLGVKKVLIATLRDGFSCLLVSNEMYEDVIVLGNKYIEEENIKNILWLDECGAIKKCGYFDIALLELPESRIGNYMWAIESKLPKDISNYINKMKEFLGISVVVEYYNDCNSICLSIKNLEQEVYREVLELFVKKEGVGPFERIIPMEKFGTLSNYEYVNVISNAKTRKKEKL